ncbi:hypothetical protein [Mycobacterium leprae]|nr:hypothetical protein [Mycobacterium leprae]
MTTMVIVNMINGQAITPDTVELINGFPESSALEEDVAHHRSLLAGFDCGDHQHIREHFSATLLIVNKNLLPNTLCTVVG